MLYYLGRSVWLLWCWLELAAFTLILYALSWLPRPLTRGYYHGLFLSWCKFFVRALGVDLRVHQKHLKPLPKQYILIANHPSALEDVGIPAMFDVYPLAKEGVRHWFLVGRLNYAADTLFVKREDPESRHAAFEQIVERLKKGQNIALFPEGGCKGRRIFKMFYYGAFEASLKTGIPIVPVFLHHEAQETFEWQDPHTLIDKLWHIMTSQNNRVNYYVHDAFYPTDFKDKQSYSEQVHQQYLQWQKQYLE